MTVKTGQLWRKDGMYGIPIHEEGIWRVMIRVRGQHGFWRWVLEPAHPRGFVDCERLA